MAENTDKSLRNQLMYQIFVRNFSADGTFLSIIPELDRIHELGTDIIYLLPIHPLGVKCRKGTLGSPYANRDYRGINPEYGNEDDFKKLVDEIHARGMKCIIDVVYNHTSPDSVLASEHPEWFYHKPDGSFGNRVGDWSDIIDLDYSNFDLWDYQIDTLKKWAEIVDGFRCDVAPMVPVAFWEKARAEVENVRPGAIWLAESVEPDFITSRRHEGIYTASDSELYKAFDICYDYDIFGEWQAYLTGHGSLARYADAVNRQEYIYPDNYIKLRFLENHDRARAAFFLRDEKALRNATAFLFFQKGLTLIYAGEEIGAIHRPDLFDSDKVDWDAEDQIDLSELISTLSKIKKKDIFTESTYEVKAYGENIILATHRGPAGFALGLFSLDGRPATIPFDFKDGVYTNEIDGKPVEIYEGRISSGGEPIIILP